MPQTAARKHFTKSSYLNVTKDEVLFYRAIEANKDICQRFVIRWEQVIRDRGETVSGALGALRLKGVIISRIALHKFKTRQYDNFSGVTLNLLAQYAGFPSFIEMVTEGK